MDSKKVILNQIAKRLRYFSLVTTTKAGSGHPTTCLSAADLMACLMFDEMSLNPADPHDWANDELVLSKGHAAPLLWATYAEAGLIDHRQLMTLRQINSVLEGHPTPRMKWVKAATGSLGQGLSVGVGMALAYRLVGSPARVFVLMGDGECAEGAVWEAANSAHDFKLNNLWAIVDINRLGQSEETMHGHDVAAFERKFKAFGWQTFMIDGHDIDQILKAFQEAKKSSQPVAILAKTIKGKGVSFLEDRNGWHGKPLSQEKLTEALAELGPIPTIEAASLVKRPQPFSPPRWPRKFAFKRGNYEVPTPTRRAYGRALVRLGQINNWVVAIDGDVKNSTYAEDFFREFPQRSFQCYIAEQNMVGIGLGLAVKGFLPFVATFAAFLTRAHDQIRMSGCSLANLKFVGSHVGVSIGADGPSQMGLEDIAMFRALPGGVVLYPCDAYSTEACLENLARYQGIGYLRTTRPATPLVYSRGEKFPIGGSKILRRSPQDKALVVAAGITVFEALKAYDKLVEKGIRVRIMDAYSVQPIDRQGLLQEAKEVGGKVVVVEDHYPAGGLGEAVAAALAGQSQIIHLAVSDLPRSGSPQELLDKFGLSASHIEQAVLSLVT